MKKQAPEGLIECGFSISVQNIDSRMWDAEFSRLPKCPVCGFRTDFFATNEDFRPKHGGRDIGDTWDNALIVSRRFREFCRRNHLNGLEFRPVGVSGVTFHAVPNRFVDVDPDQSPFEYFALCERCENPEWFVTRGHPMVLRIAEPLGDGFWATNILLGSGNTKGPGIIINQRTRAVLQGSGLKGSFHTEPVYAQPNPRLITAATHISKKKVVKISRSNKALPRSGRLEMHPFATLLSAPAPAFRCQATSDKKRVTLIAIQHDVNDRPTKDDLRFARQLLGRVGRSLLDFYKNNNGADLYRGVRTDEVGVRFFPISQWKKETAAMRHIFASLPKKERPEVLTRAIAFGEPPQSGHHFAIVTKGRDSGSVILTNHETLSADEFAPNFNEFLKIICIDPVDLLVNQLGSYVRYRDGLTQDEWIPIEYLPNSKSAKSKSEGQIRFP